MDVSNCDGGVAAGLVRTARDAVRLTALDVAAAAGCTPEMIQDIEAGRLDPTLDTVNRIVNSIGLEVRAGFLPVHDPHHEVDRLRKELQHEAEVAELLGVKDRTPGPREGTQVHWDGTDPAPPRLFGAGPTRGDGGGWAALLIRGKRTEAKMTIGELATAADLDVAEIQAIETGATKPAVAELQRILEAMGASLSTHLELYEHHDDRLHLKAVADLGGYRRRMADRSASLARTVALSRE